MAEEYFNKKNGDSQMVLYAIGNCHIDTGESILFGINTFLTGNTNITIHVC